MFKDLVYIIKKEDISKEFLINLLVNHSEIKFVSLVGIDLNGNDTDEKIPTDIFLNDIDTFLNGCAVQTDGSSVVLTGIATLNDAKVDMVIDKNCTWFVDYNFDNIDESTEKPIGTLRIPSFLIHNNKYIDSRSILNRSVKYLKENILTLLKNTPDALEKIKYEDIDDIIINTATELEFWVKTPEDSINIEALTTSQELHEQYWNMTKGIVRTALEKSLLMMENYDLKPEMGHKEVGGIKSKIDFNGKFHILEQLEIDWKYSSSPIQTCDNVLIVKSIIKETFKRHNLDVDFCAKPIEKVAGNGEHLHYSIFLKLKNGNIINLFHNEKNEFLSSIGYGALMGILKNYEVINPFVSNTIDSLKRLKPGFEAPVCTVTSLGISKKIPSRNRSILLALIRDIENPKATRFELRSPNPKSNIYLTLASLNMCVIDGITYSINKEEPYLLKELSKNYGEKCDYLEEFRIYRSEENIFENFSEDERNKYFGKSPKSVYENMENLSSDKINLLLKGNVFTPEIINSFRLSSLDRYVMEINHRIIPEYKKDIECLINNISINTKLNSLTKFLMNEINFKIFSDTFNHLSLFSHIKDSIKNRNVKKISELHIEIEKLLESLKNINSL